VLKSGGFFFFQILVHDRISGLFSSAFYIREQDSAPFIQVSALLIPRDSQASKQLGIEQRLWLAAGRRSQIPGWSDVRPIQPVATLDPILSFHYSESIMQKGKVRRVSALYRELQRLELLAGQRN